jgi:predicted dehydrogenase
MNIINIVGARPNCMKIAPLMQAFRAQPAIESLLVHTGQHYDEKMSDLFFRQLGITKPNLNLEVGGGSHAHQTAAIMTAFEPICQQYRPDADLVAGDVNSTVACGVVAGVIGAGSFAQAVLIPALARTPARLAWVANRNGLAAAHAARKFGIEKATSDYRRILEDPEVNTVFIVTGHAAHGRLATESLAAGKQVFVEKPLCIREEELAEIGAAYARRVAGGGPVQLMVGFNRRFSPHTVRMKELLAGRSEPLAMAMTVNAGAIPPGHWTQNPEVGGGRIVGEGCHFIDLLAFLAGAPVARVSAMMVGEGPAVREDKMAMTLGFADGSVGTVNYYANGAKSYPKETLEVFSDGRVLRMENFRQTTGYGFKGFTRLKTWRQNKGHNEEIARFVEGVGQGSGAVMEYAEIENTTKASLAAVKSAKTGQICKV